MSNVLAIFAVCFNVFTSVPFSHWKNLSGLHLWKV